MAIVRVLILLLLGMLQMTAVYAVTGNWDWRSNPDGYSQEDAYYDWFRFTTKEDAANDYCSVPGDEYRIKTLVYVKETDSVELWFVNCELKYVSSDGTEVWISWGGADIWREDPCYRLWSDVPVCCPYGTIYNYDIRRCEAFCPGGSMFSEKTGLCQLPLTKSCSGNPIKTFTGEKLQVETDYLSQNSLLSLKRTYANEANLTRDSDHWLTSAPNLLTGTRTYLFLPYAVSQLWLESQPALASNPNFQPDFIPSFAFDTNWRWSFEHTLMIHRDVSPVKVIAVRGNGSDIVFIDGRSSYLPGVTLDVMSGDPNGYAWKLTLSDQIEYYSSEGKLLRVERLSDQAILDLSYDTAGKLTAISDAKGHAITFSRNSQGKVGEAHLPDGNLIQYDYDALGNLETVTYPSLGTPAVRRYHYENSLIPHALTGITDENGQRIATWTYDDKGRAITSEHAGGVDRVELDYSMINYVYPYTKETNPLNKDTRFYFKDYGNLRRVINVQGLASTHCEAANQAYEYDTSGYLIGTTDWNGDIMTYTRNAEGQELSRTEASGTADARTITTEWHPDFPKPIRITEPDRITEFNYDAEGRLLYKREYVTP